ncbi:unnamed protein product [Caenorhabditis angaria]|uniref:C-type lectin domain-containing protein n=1 Tax=Caenorhabditis angaria TaxID=860376 RepID=A0A9P1N7H2_9PELO|nr:unnamed protein product [Caenorhabditis angaria]
MKLVFAFALLFFINFAVSQGCSDGQFAYYSSCLQFMRTPLDFHTANSVCSGFNGHLVSIHNAIDNRNVASQAKHYVDGPFWVGARSIAADVNNLANWYWTDGTKFNYQNYQAGQPVSQGSTSCMEVLSATAKWFTANCTATLLPYFCEFPAPIEPTCSTPICASHCPSGYTWFSETDYCYKNYVQSTTFDVARKTCIADGGELASIHSQAENDFLVEFTKSGITNTTSNGWNEQVYIGYIYQNQKWQWTDGTSSNFVNWAVGEPNKMDFEWWTTLVADYQLVLETYENKWNNVGNITERAFVCKHAVLH